jgi:acyl-CoA synthetase (AMP-forming)/AMP-acid ligase II
VQGYVCEIGQADASLEAPSSGLNQRLDAGMTAALWDSLLSTKGRRGLVTHTGSVAEEHRWDDLVAASEGAAVGLAEVGVERGTPVGLVLTNGVAACTATLGIWLCGGTVVSLPTRTRGETATEYRTGLAGLARQAGAGLVLVEASQHDDIPADFLASSGLRVRTCEELHRASRAEPDLPEEDDVVFIQYSSGTTGEPQGCQLSARAIHAQLKGLAEALSLDVDSDRGAMWLPLSHDMGFFGGLLLFWSLGLPGWLSSPGRFVVSPRSWLDECAQFGATLTVAPNFALDLAARAVARRGPSTRLGLRAVIVGGEQVQATTLQRAADALGPFGMRPEALTPAYGLAEATLAVTVGDVDARPTAIELDSHELADGNMVEADGENHAASLVSVGRPLAGVAVGVAERTDVGELVVRSPSLADGYVGQPEATEERFRNGELRTGDLGFLVDDELYVVGRDDDILVIAGRNIDARRVEQAMCTHPNLRPGDAALVDRHEDGRPNLVAYVESRSANPDTQHLVQELAESVRAVLPVPVDEWVLLRRGRIPKTPSGKTRRFRLRRSPPGHDDIVARIAGR